MLEASSAFGVDRAPDFGWTLALEGDHAIVGAPALSASPAAPGRAFAFRRSNGVWLPWHALEAPSSVAGDGFGREIALDGTRVIIGGNADAWIFRRDATGWIVEDRLPGAAASVAIDGTTAVVGGLPARVYTRSGERWVERASLHPPDGEQSDGFGAAVGLSGETVIVGAPAQGAARPGSVLVFTGSGSTWTRQERLRPLDSGAQDLFGMDVALEADTAIVGAPGSQNAYAFTRTSVGWLQERSFEQIAPGPLGGPRLDADMVALAGDLAVVANTFGRLDMFRRHPGGVWVFEAQLSDRGFGLAMDVDTVATGSPGEGDLRAGATRFIRLLDRSVSRVTPGLLYGNEEFGAAVAIDGDVVVVGAPDAHGGTASGDGAVYIYRRSGQTWRQEARITSPIPRLRFGTSVDIAGDLVAAGASGPGSPAHVMLLRRTQDGWLHEATIQTPSSDQSMFGYSVALAVAGAEERLVVGDPKGGAGRAFVFDRGSSWRLETVLEEPDGIHGGWLGASVDIAFVESSIAVAVGATHQDITPTVDSDQGHVVVFRGPSWAIEDRLEPSRSVPNERFGGAVSLGSGGLELAVGAPTGSPAGALYRYSFRSDGHWASRETLVAPTGSEAFGVAVDISRSPILIVGDPEPETAGRVHVVTTLLDTVVGPDPVPGDGFGTDVAAGSSFLLVGAPGAGTRGRVYSFFTPISAASDAYTIPEDTVLTQSAPGVLGNDVGDQIEAELVGGASHGAVSLSPDGSFTYEPVGDFFGADLFTYRAVKGEVLTEPVSVSITVTAMPDPPVAIDDEFQTPENVALSVPAAGVLSNDVDADGDRLTAVIDDEPSNGALSLQADGSFTYSPRRGFVGTDLFTYRASDGAVSSEPATVVITVVAVNDPPLIAIAPVTQLVDHSDEIASISISASDDSPLEEGSLTTTWGPEGGSVVPGLPEGLALTSGGCEDVDGISRCSWSIDGLAAIAPDVYVIRGTISDGENEVAETASLTVEPEDARTAYTGTMLVSSRDDGQATVTLRSTIQDITAVPSDPASDPTAGDIRNATVTFVDRDTGEALCVASVQLINPSDVRTATASCTWTMSLSQNEQSQQRSIGTIVGGWYERDDPNDDVLVTITRNGGGSVSGGGYLIVRSSGGMYSADAGSNENFGFGIRSTSGGRLRGRGTVVFRSGGHTYKIKSTSLVSLGVAATSVPLRAEIDAKAILEDVSDPGEPVSLGGGLALRITATDAGEPGSEDTIGVTLWARDGSLLHSSLWSHVATVEQILDGGNVVIRS